MEKLFINHEPTKEALVSIMECVRKQGKAYQRYVEQMDESKDNAMYSAEYLQGLADKNLEQVVSIAVSNRELFDKYIEDARVCENKNNDIIDISDSVLQSAISIVNVCGENLTADVASGIIESMKGQKKALDIIKSVMETKKVSVPSYDLKYCYNSNSLLNGLQEKADAVAYDPKNPVVYIKVKREVSKVADILGIALTDEELNTGLDEERVNENRLRASMDLAAK